MGNNHRNLIHIVIQLGNNSSGVTKIFITKPMKNLLLIINPTEVIILI